LIRHGQQWLEVENQRMDALIVVRDGCATCRRLRDIRAGDEVVSGMRGIRVVPESKERDRLSFAFMSNGISSERQLETAVRQTAALVQQAIEQKQDVVVVAGPVVSTPAARFLWRCCRRRYTSPVERQCPGCTTRRLRSRHPARYQLSDGRQEEHGHRNHMRAINTITIAAISDRRWSGCPRSGILYECVKKNAPTFWRAVCETAGRRLTPSPT
jgi:hypothetical protein